MEKNSVDQIEKLKRALSRIVAAQLEFSGYWSSDERYVPTSLQNSDVDPVLQKRFLALACKLDGLRTDIESI